MSPVRRLARPMLAAVFVSGGLSALRHPAPRVALAQTAGLTDAERLVRLNAATMLGGGLALATGRAPRLASLVLAGTLVPTTVVGHPFWSEQDAARRAQQQTQFLKNLSVLGGLLVSAADTGGRESLPHAAGRLSRRAARRARKHAG